MDILAKAFSGGALSEVTKANYESRLKRMEALTKKTVEFLMLHPNETFVAIKRAYTELQSQKAMINAFLTLFKHSEKLDRKAKTAYKVWKSIFATVNDVIKERYDNNVATEAQLEAYVPLAEVIAKRDALDKGSMEYLLLSMYTKIPPVRADYGNVRILAKEPATEEERKQGNYLIVAPKKMTLRLNEFKSKGRRFPQYEKELPADLDGDIRNSLKKWPRTHLFMSKKTMKPYARDNTYVVFVLRMTERVFGKPIGVSMLRRIYVNGQDYNKMTTEEKKQLSDDMLHSVMMNDQYRLKMD